MEIIQVKGYEDVDNNFADFLEGTKKGIIKLPIEVININTWYGERLSFFASFLQITQKELEYVLYYASCIIQKEDGTFAVMNEKECQDAGIKYEITNMGAPAIRRALEKITEEQINAMFKKARETERDCMAKLEEIEEAEKNDDITETDVPCEEPEEPEMYPIIRELQNTRLLLDAIWEYSRTDWSKYFISEIKLFTLETRSMLKQYNDVDIYAINHGLPDLYGRVASLSNNIRRLNELNVPEFILRDKSRKLQEYVDELLSNGKRERPVCRITGGPAYLSLSDIALKTMKLV